VTLPNFIILGAQKAGTTSLYQYLKQHPEVFMSPVKEPKFFNEDFEDGNRGEPNSGSLRGVSSLEEYRALFDGATNEKAVGEASPSYLYLPEVPTRIERYVPEAKLIATLRDPAERAYSSYLHQVRAGREPLDFLGAIRDEERRVREGWHYRYHYRGRSLYHAQLTRYHAVFSPERLQVHLYEDFREDPISVSQNMFRFLGVDDSFIPDTSLRHNVSGLPKSRALFWFLKKPSPLRTALRTFVPKGLRKNLFVSLRSRNLSKVPPMPEEARMDLIEAYREDVRRLQDLIGRDLSGWLAVKKP